MRIPRVTMGVTFAILVGVVVILAIATGGIKDIWWMVLIFAVLIAAGFIGQRIKRNK